MKKQPRLDEENTRPRSLRMAGCGSTRFAFGATPRSLPCVPTPLQYLWSHSLYPYPHLPLCLSRVLLTYTSSLRFRFVRQFSDLFGSSSVSRRDEPRARLSYDSFLSKKSHAGAFFLLFSFFFLCNYFLKQIYLKDVSNFLR